MKGMRLSDYQALRFEEPIPKMDVVFHTVGGAAAHSSDRGLHGRSSAKARPRQGRRCCRSAGRCYRKKLICPLYDHHR
jgi:hypothetical protein